MACQPGSEKAASPDLLDFLPSAVAGWQRTAASESYDRETIFDYINGAGEVYLQFGYQECLVQRYTRESDTLVVELFDMNSSADAFGIFSYIREAPEFGIGRASQRVGSVLHFWQDRYFVSIYPEKPSVDSKTAALTIGKTVAEKIGADGELPTLIDLLPERGIDNLSVRFFHRHASLNYHYYLASKNILQLDESTNAVLAEYFPDKTKLLIVEYGDAARADAALVSFRNIYLETSQEAPVELETDHWVSAQINEIYLVVVFDAASAAVTNELTNTAIGKIERQISSEESK
jgi:hypothetical protein